MVPFGHKAWPLYARQGAGTEVSKVRLLQSFEVALKKEAAQIHCTENTKSHTCWPHGF